MTPHVNNLHQAAENGEVEPVQTIPSVLASARAVLTDKQKENGVAVVDFGATTTGVAVFEDGDLQFLKVIPLGSVNITNDLAIGLKITPEIAEDIKIKHALAGIRSEHIDIMIKSGREHYSFNTEQIDEIVDARLEEIFEEIEKALKDAGCAKQLPNGIVLVGGGSNLKGLPAYSKRILELASQIGEVDVQSSISDDIQNPEFAAAVGLMLENIQNVPRETRIEKRHNGFFARLFNRNK